MHGGLEIPFDHLHKTHNKCTPTQIMYYQMALNLFKIVNNSDHELSFESLTVFDQVICTRRQIKFQIQRNFTSKIGLNTITNKLYHLNNLIGLDLLNLTLDHLKKRIMSSVSRLRISWSIISRPKPNLSTTPVSSSVKDTFAFANRSPTCLGLLFH
jgi:hypothetical protein